MTNTQIRRQLFDASGMQKIEVNEDTEFDKVVMVKGYACNNMQDLRDLFECSVINLQQYEDLISQLEMGEIGIVKKRKKYKELYEEQQQTIGYLRSANNRYAMAFNELAELQIEEVDKILEKIRRL